MNPAWKLLRRKLWRAVMKGLIKKTKQHFEGMKDPRTQCPALRHSYAGMLAMIAVAMMFAANGPTAVVRFWNDIAGHRPRRRHGLLRALGLEKLPSHDALGRVMAATDPDALDQAVQAGRRLMDRRGKAAARHRHIAVDGKACRGSASPANDVEAALVVNAVDVDTQRVLATVATPGTGQRRCRRHASCCVARTFASTAPWSASTQRTAAARRSIWCAAGAAIGSCR